MIPAVIEDFPVVAIECAFPKTIVSIVFPDSVTAIYGVFKDTGYTGCCEDCKFLTKVVLPKNLTYIPSNMFYGCAALKKFTLLFLYPWLPNRNGSMLRKHTSGVCGLLLRSIPQL